MKEINKNRFDVYVMYTRHNLSGVFNIELKWFENEELSIFGVITRDRIDFDFSVVLFGRNHKGVIEDIDLKTCFPDVINAEYWLRLRSKEIATEKDMVYKPEDVNRKSRLFNQVAHDSKVDPYFNVIASMPSHSAARNLINEIMPHFHDVDGNFIKQFQTTGFDARLWELYLFCFFKEQELIINKDYNAPDFYLKNKQEEIGVEAVIVGRKNDENESKRFESPSFTDHVSDILEDSSEKISDIMPIRFGSSLLSKVNHTNKKGQHYWELTHIHNKPFVLAIADFHNNYSMIWSQASLVKYLYGYDYTHSHDSEGILEVQQIRISEHRSGSKAIASGFFNSESNKYISAVLSTSVGTISKFSRMGKQAGMDETGTIIFRTKTVHDHRPNAATPLLMAYLVDENCNETWGEGVVVYHNPNAIHPLSTTFFDNIAQFFLVENLVKCYIPEKHVYSSMNMILMENED